MTIIAHLPNLTDHVQVGVAAVHLAQARGLNVIATGGTEEGRKMLKDQGVEHVLNHREENYLSKVKVSRERKNTFYQLFNTYAKGAMSGRECDWVCPNTRRRTKIATLQ